MTMALLCTIIVGEFADLSVPSVFGFAATIWPVLVTNHHWGTVPAMLVAVIAAVACGAVKPPGNDLGRGGPAVPARRPVAPARSTALSHVASAPAAASLPRSRPIRSGPVSHRANRVGPVSHRANTAAVSVLPARTGVAAVTAPRRLGADTRHRAATYEL